MNQLPFIQMIQLYVCVDESHEVKALITMLHSWTTQDERWDSLKCENIEQMAEPAIYGWSFLCHVSVVALWKTLIMESCVSITNTSPILLSIFSLSYLLLQCLIVSDCRLCVCVLIVMVWVWTYSYYCISKHTKGKVTLVLTTYKTSSLLNVIFMHIYLSVLIKDIASISSWTYCFFFNFFFFFV